MYLFILLFISLHPQHTLFTGGRLTEGVIFATTEDRYKKINLKPTRIYKVPITAQMCHIFSIRLNMRE